MGKKSGRSNAVVGADNAAAAAQPKAFVLKVPTHCRCDGCDGKVRAGVKDLLLRCDGIVSVDQSALATRGELALVATADPERLRRRLRKATGKAVGLLFPKPAKDAAGKDAAAAFQAMLLGLQQQQQQQQAAAAVVHHGIPWNAAALQVPHGAAAAAYGQQAAYPWLVQQHQQAALPVEPYLASYPAAPAAWGAYAAAYPHTGGAYGGGWLGY